MPRNPVATEKLQYQYLYLINLNIENKYFNTKYTPTTLNQLYFKFFGGICFLILAASISLLLYKNPHHSSFSKQNIQHKVLLFPNVVLEHASNPWPVASVQIQYY